MFASQILQHLADWINSWDGLSVSPKASRPLALSGPQKLEISANPERAFLPHEEGRVFRLSPRNSEREEFATPPRSQMGECQPPEAAPESAERRRPSTTEIYDVPGMELPKWELQGRSEAAKPAPVSSPFHVLVKNKTPSLVASNGPGTTPSTCCSSSAGPF